MAPAELPWRFFSEYPRPRVSAIASDGVAHHPPRVTSKSKTDHDRSHEQIATPPWKSRRFPCDGWWATDPSAMSIRKGRRAARDEQYGAHPSHALRPLFHRYPYVTMMSCLSARARRSISLSPLSAGALREAAGGSQSGVRRYLFGATIAAFPWVLDYALYSPHDRFCVLSH